MIENVNPDHPDKVADRIAGALVDMAYAKQDNPRIAVEVLLGHGECNIIAETSAKLSVRDVWNAVWRITGNDEITVRYREYQQDEHLAENQSEGFRFEKGDRICQMVVMPYCPCEVVPVEDLEGSERGTDGHGSTGVR